MNDNHGNVLINPFLEELENVHDVRVLGFSLCENLKGGHGFGLGMSTTSVMSVMSAF